MTHEHDRDDEQESIDEAAIRSRRRVLITGALVGGAATAAAMCKPCLSVARPEPCLNVAMQRTAEFSRTARPLTAAANVPAALLERTQSVAIYAAGGGLTSTPWRVEIDLYGHCLAARGTSAGQSSLGHLADQRRTVLLSEALSPIVALADRVWREPREPNTQPTADYDEVLLFRDGEDLFYLQGFGPIRGGSAQQLIERLRAFTVWNTPDAGAPPG